MNKVYIIVKINKEISTHNLNGFIIYYKCGDCYRILED